jgi:beta-phosphoglucomutase family hydrolase
MKRLNDDIIIFMIRAVIFDLDDTMVNSDPLHARAWEELLKNYGYKFSDLPQELRSNFIGMRVADIVNELIDYLQLNTNKEKFYKKRVEIFLKIVKKELQVMPGLIYSLKLMKDNNYKLAVASSGAKKYIELVLEKFDIKHYFDVIITGDDVIKGKPNPETYLIACKKLNLKPSECLVLEDATKGIRSAKAAECSCIAVKNPNIPEQSYPEADLVLESLNKLTLDVVRQFD